MKMEELQNLDRKAIVRNAWNHVSDEYNQWDALSQQEKDELMWDALSQQEKDELMDAAVANVEVINK